MGIKTGGLSGIAFELEALSNKIRLAIARAILPKWMVVAMDEHSKFFTMIYDQLGPQFIQSVLREERKYGYTEEVVDLGTGKRYPIH